MLSLTSKQTALYRSGYQSVSGFKILEICHFQQTLQLIYHTLFCEAFEYTLLNILWLNYITVLLFLNRLTPTYMFVLLFFHKMTGFLGEGPFWYGVQTETQCSKYWWTNLLYINNFYPTSFRASVSFCSKNYIELQD